MERFKRSLFPSTVSTRVLCVALIPFQLAMNLWFLTPTVTLHVKEVNAGVKLVAIPVSQGEALKVEYIHSIYRVKQSEVYSVGRDLRFYLEKVTFESYAAAAYYDSDPPQGVAFKDGLWMIRGDGKHYSVLKYRVNPGTGHVLTLKNLRVNLSGNSKTPGGLIEISLDRDVGN